jgi:ribosome maturation protein Sdo1
MQRKPLSEEGGFLLSKSVSNRNDEENHFHKIIIEKTIFMCYSISEGEKAKSRNVERAFGGCAKQEEATSK